MQTANSETLYNSRCRCITPSFRGTQAPPLGTYRRRLAESPAEQARWDALAAQHQLQAEVPVIAL